MKSAQFSIAWRDLSCKVKLSLLDKILLKFHGHREIPDFKSILNEVGGEFKSRQLMAIMGPSGSGKSTLLKSIFKRKFEGRSGKVYCHTDAAGGDGSGSSSGGGGGGRLSFAFIPQQDTFFDLLTVRESVVFAARLKYNSKVGIEETWANQAEDIVAAEVKKNNRSWINFEVDNLLKALGLDGCADNKVRVCSGGQLKRLSIAQELVKRPHVLVLDEPTSGLDSSSSEQLIKYLRELTDTSTPVAIAATIHQPNYKIFSLFHRVYVLSRQGTCIYDGPPTEVVKRLAKHGLDCPRFYNPADYVIEVASGEYGLDKLEFLSLAQKEELKAADTNQAGKSNKPLTDVILEQRHPAVSHSLILALRSFLTTVRDPWASGLRLGIHLVFGIFVGFLYGSVGLIDGCPPAVTGATFDPQDLEAIQNRTKIETQLVIDNCGSVFFSLFVILYTGILSTTLTFPSEMSTIVKEKSNGWYNVGVYFLGKTLADIPFQIFFPLVYGFLTYYIQRQIPDLARFLGYMFIQILISLISQSQGLLVGALFVRLVTAGVYVAPLTTIPWFLFSGYFIKTSSLPTIYTPLSLLSCLKHGFEANLIMIYGFGRCGENVKQNMMEMRNSMVDWFSDMFGVVDTSDHSNLTSTGVTSTFVDSVVELVSGDYVEKDGAVKPSAFITFEIRDEFWWLNLLTLLVTFVGLRTAAFLVIRCQLNRLQ